MDCGSLGQAGVGGGQPSHALVGGQAGTEEGETRSLDGYHSRFLVSMEASEQCDFQRGEAGRTNCKIICSVQSSRFGRRWVFPVGRCLALSVSDPTLLLDVD
jgi:hypothetical protein